MDNYWPCPADTERFFSIILYSLYCCCCCCCDDDVCNQWKGISTLGQNHHGTREKNTTFLSLPFPGKNVKLYSPDLTSLSGYNCTKLSRLFGIGKCFFFLFFFVYLFSFLLFLYRFLVLIRYSPSRDSRPFVQFCFPFFLGFTPGGKRLYGKTTTTTTTNLTCITRLAFWFASRSRSFETPTTL